MKSFTGSVFYVVNSDLDAGVSASFEVFPNRTEATLACWYCSFVFCVFFCSWRLFRIRDPSKMLPLVLSTPLMVPHRSRRRLERLVVFALLYDSWTLLVLLRSTRTKNCPPLSSTAWPTRNLRSTSPLKWILALEVWRPANGESALLLVPTKHGDVGVRIHCKRGRQ